MERPLRSGRRTCRARVGLGWDGSGRALSLNAGGPRTPQSHGTSGPCLRTSGRGFIVLRRLSEGLATSEDGDTSGRGARGDR